MILSVDNEGQKKSLVRRSKAFLGQAALGDVRIKGFHSENVIITRGAGHQVIERRDCANTKPSRLF